MTAKMGSQLGVFISYSREDRFVAETLAQRLPKVGYRPWVDFEGIVGGDEWKQSIEIALSKSAAVLVLLTHESISSKWVKYEIQLAQTKNCPIIPLMIRKCDIPEELEQYQFVDFRQGIDRAFEDLQRALLSAVVRNTDENPTEPSMPVIAPPQNPAEQVAELPLVKNEKPLALVIEDAASTQELLRDMLTDLGLEVHIARSRNEATTFIQSKQRYDFATLDMQLGPDDDFGQEGIYLLDLLKRYQTDTPVVIITRLPYDKRQTAEFFTKGRIKDMLDKPVDQERLRGLVEQHVLRRRRV